MKKHKKYYHGKNDRWLDNSKFFMSFHDLYKPCVSQATIPSKTQHLTLYSWTISLLEQVVTLFMNGFLWSYSVSIRLTCGKISHCGMCKSNSRAITTWNSNLMSSFADIRSLSSMAYKMKKKISLWQSLWWWLTMSDFCSSNYHSWSEERQIPLRVNENSK